MSLSDACRKQLEEAETRVEMLIRKEGKIAAEPFRPEKPRKHDLRESLAQQQRLVDSELDRLVPPETTPPETIHRAMRYSLFAGGKRIRPYFV